MTCAARAPRKGVLTRTRYAHSRKELDSATRCKYEGTRLSTPQATTIATRRTSSPPKVLLQGVHHDVEQSTTLLTRELRATFADATRAGASYLSAPPSTIRYRASKHSHILWAHDRLPPARTISEEGFATIGQPLVDKLPPQGLISSDSRYTQSTYAEKARLVTRPEDLD